MTWARALLGAVGLAAVGWGVVQLLPIGFEAIWHVAVWMAAAVLVHDLLLAPLVVVLGALVVPRLPGYARAAYVVAVLVVGTVTLAVLPTLGRFAAKPGDPWLLNRPYLEYWLGFVALALIAATAAAVRARSRASET